MRKLWSEKVGEAGHYLNRPGELRGGVLELLRAKRVRLEQCVPLVHARRTLLPSPTSDMGEIANHAWFTERFGMSPTAER
jgi:hypothetical protein